MKCNRCNSWDVQLTQLGDSEFVCYECMDCGTSPMKMHRNKQEAWLAWEMFQEAQTFDPKARKRYAESLEDFRRATEHGVEK